MMWMGDGMAKGEIAEQLPNPQDASENENELDWLGKESE